MLREKNLPGRQGLIHLHAEMRSPGNPDNVPGLIHPVYANQRFVRVLRRSEYGTVR